ncbi:MAG: long-chain fatty acid--CoA ligase [Bacteroidota bacterium]|nr:long-chain fatty acid--CoA ligase [Bacteroidota bacterium]
MDEHIWYKSYDNGVSHTIETPEKPIHEILEEKAGISPEQTLLICMNKKISFGRLLKNINSFAQSLIDLGVQKNDRICFLLPNLIQFPVVHFAILKIGGISVPMNPLLTKHEIEKLIKLSGAKIVLVLDKFYQKVETIRQNSSVEKIIISKTGDFFPLPYKMLLPFLSNQKRVDYTKPNIISFSKLLKQKDIRFAPVDVSMDDTAVLLGTGGTTGTPKLAALSHRNLVANSRQLAEWVVPYYKKGDTMLAALPFFHSFGLTIGLHLSSINGLKTVMIPRFNVKGILKAIRRYNVNYFPGVPTMFAAINDYEKSGQYNFSSLKSCISGGFELNPEVQSKFEKLSRVKIIESYGLTEATPAAISTPMKGTRKTKSIGVPLPSTYAKIVDQETSENLPVGSIGELIIKGPQVMNSYWQNQDETNNTIRNGWLFTGDLARMDEDGYFYIMGRKKELIKYCGFNVFPQEVEEALLKHPKVVQAGVTGIKDVKCGEIIKAYIVLNDGQKVSEQELLEHCKLFVAKYKLPHTIEFAENLPRNFAGKVLRRQLSELSKSQKSN